jgi:HEAT repeat protein
MSDRLVLSPVASQALAVLSRSLLSAARTSSLYPADHPVVRASARALDQAIDLATGAGIGAGIAVTPATLFVRGASAVDELPRADAHAIADTAAMLHQRGILEIGFDAAVPPEAISRLLAFLTRLGSGEAGEGQIAEAWAREGHPAIRIEAIDYRTLLEERQASRTSAQHDDIWRAIVAALRSGRQTLDQREQQRLLELADDPDELAGLAETLMADKCTPDGSPMVGSQAAAVLSCFRHLASIASVIAPDRSREILRNLTGALLRIDPHVTMQVLSLEGDTNDAMTLRAALDEEGLAHLIVAVVGLDGTASPRLAQMFELLMPDRGSQRRVLDRARSLAEARPGGAGRPFDAVWSSIEELLLSYNDEQFVSQEYRAVLDGTRGEHGQDAIPPTAEMTEWLETLGEPGVRALSIVLLIDLLQLEPTGERAVVILGHMSELAEELLLSGVFDDARRMLQAIAGAGARSELSGAVAETLERLGTGTAAQQVATAIGDLDPEAWGQLEGCYVAIGPSALALLVELLLPEQDTQASARAGAVFVALGQPAVAPLTELLDRAGSAARCRVAALLGRIGSASAVPALQALLRTQSIRVMQAAVAALAGISDPAAARAIQVALRSADGPKREALVNALVTVNDRRVVPMLVRVLAECRPLATDFHVALHTLDALGRLADPRAVPPIVQIMGLHTWFSRRRLRALKRAAVHALGRMGDAAADVALDAASRDGDRMLRGIIRARRTASAGVA